MTKACLKVELVIFSVFSGKLKVFLQNEILPAGVLKDKESLNTSAKRIFREKTGLSLSDSYLEQLYTFSRLNNGCNKIAVVYYILLPSHIIPSEDKKNWLDINTISKNTPHFEVIKYAVKRLRWKIEYTNVVYSLLPKEFTFSQLQNVYEAILGRTLDKRNFRKKILSLGILKATGKKKKLGKARPAEMFSFRRRKLTIVEVL